jgi:hypothetical protein
VRKVTVARPQKIQLPFSKGKVLVDSNELAEVKKGSTVVFEIPDGAHNIQVVFKAVPAVESNILPISESDGDLSFEIKIVVPLKSEPTYAILTKK